ncbi:MAG: AAA family ATPase, partial [Candidatus Heimdallarchaeota archaeon]|nr:AAA family ATPase [Candidatus Heimdallarchaeota archaeon]
MSKSKIKDLETLPPETQKALIKAGYKSANAIVIAIPSDLAEDAGISEDVAEEIIAEAISKVISPPLSAVDLLRIEMERGKVSTSSSSLDDLLGGGPWTGEITEIAGAFASGKSQLCFQLAVNAQRSKDEGGLGGKVFYVDTEGTFSAIRLGEIALGQDLDPSEVLGNILVARVLDSQHQTRIVQKINSIAEKENIRMVIIDSIASHFRSDYIGPAKLIERQQR